MFWFERDRRIRVTVIISPEEGNTCLRTSPPRWPPTCGPALAVPSMHPPSWKCGRGCHGASSIGWPTTGTTPRPPTRPDAWSTTCPPSSSWDEPCSTTSPTWASRTTRELPWPLTGSTSPMCWSRSPMPPWAMGGWDVWPPVSSTRAPPSTFPSMVTASSTATGCSVRFSPTASRSRSQTPGWRTSTHSSFVARRPGGSSTTPTSTSSPCPTTCR